MLKIAIAIPTYNRLEKLKPAIEAILKQIKKPSKFEISCVISNSCSTDGTYEYLEELKCKYNNIIIHNKKTDSYVNGGTNWSKLAAIMPKDVDWVWLHGDDDKMSCEDAIAKVVDCIENKDIKLLHACQSRRSTKTQEMIEGKLIELCKKFGFIEILGWMSSLIVRKDVFVKTFSRIGELSSELSKKEDLINKRISAYLHSSLLLELMANENAMFYDGPLINPQDENETQKSMERWLFEDIGYRYLFVVDDIRKLVEKGTLECSFEAAFWRYHTGYLWDRFFQIILESVLKKEHYSNEDRENMMRIKWIEESLSPSTEKVELERRIKNVTNMIEMFVKDNEESKERYRSLIHIQTRMVREAIFSFQIMI